jgi:hypothetical protein
VCCISMIVVHGCAAPESSTPPVSPYALVDQYVTFLSPKEREGWYSSVREHGLDATVRTADASESWWYTYVNAYGPRLWGRMQGESEDAYYERRARALRDLLGFVKSLPPPDTRTARLWGVPSADGE